MLLMWREWKQLSAHLNANPVDLKSTVLINNNNSNKTESQACTDFFFQLKSRRRLAGSFQVCSQWMLPVLGANYHHSMLRLPPRYAQKSTPCYKQTTTLLSANYHLLCKSPSYYFKSTTLMCALLACVEAFSLLQLQAGFLSEVKILSDWTISERKERKIWIQASTTRKVHAVECKLTTAW